MENALLDALERQGGDGFISDTAEFCAEHGFEHAALVDSALKSLAVREFIVTKPITHERWLLTDEGERYAAEGTPELAVLRLVTSASAGGAVGDARRGSEQDGGGGGGGGGGGISLNELSAELGAGAAKLGMQHCLKRKWISLDKSTAPPVLRRALSADDPVDEAARALQSLQLQPSGAALDERQLKALKSRKLAVFKPFKTYAVSRGPRFAEARLKQATELTKAMLDSGEWERVAFKPYNFDADGRAPVSGGRLHPLLKVREQFRLIFLEMGFAEMPTNNYVESSFWNFDALFQPQQHPARDAHDTFFLSEPEFCARIGREDADAADREYVERVRRVHESGGHGSRGYGYHWERAEARKNILRTHTTAVSSRMLYRLAREFRQSGEREFAPRRYFSIDRVFRNETLDATHLAEFHQIEGLVAGRNLSLADLKGTILQFFRRLGMRRLRFKPAHNPYTEPSMEIFAFHEGFGKWVEVGNSGIFRPEMLLPMGLPEDVSVIAWGLSLERPTMIMYGVRNIRDLFGHKVDIATIETNPICRLGW